MIFSLNSSRFLIFSSCFGTREARHLSALMMPDNVSFFDSVFDSFFSSSSVKFSMNSDTMSYHNTINSDHTVLHKHRLNEAALETLQIIYRKHDQYLIINTHWLRSSFAKAKVLANGLAKIWV